MTTPGSTQALQMEVSSDHTCKRRRSRLSWKIYHSISSSFNSTGSVIEVKHECSDMSLIEVCRKEPSLRKVQSAVKRNPDCLQALNSRNQTPLHIACARGAPLDVISFLVSSFLGACYKKDEQGKLPLHYAAQPSKWIITTSEDSTLGMFDHVFTEEERKSMCLGFKNVCDNDATEKWSEYIKMLMLICKANPKASIEEDNDGMFPVEYELIDHAPMDVVSTLQCNAMVQGRQTHATCA